MPQDLLLWKKSFVGVRLEDGWVQHNQHRVCHPAMGWQLKLYVTLTVGNLTQILVLHA